MLAEARAELAEAQRRLSAIDAGNAAMAAFKVDIWTHPEIPTHQRIELSHDGCDAYCVSFQALPSPQVTMAELGDEVIRHLERTHGASPAAAPQTDGSACGRSLTEGWCPDHGTGTPPAAAPVVSVPTTAADTSGPTKRRCAYEPGCDGTPLPADLACDRHPACAECGGLIMHDIGCQTARAERLAALAAERASAAASGTGTDGGEQP